MVVASAAAAAAPREHLFQKCLTPSDVGKLNRLVIPKQHAERCFPLDSSANEKGLMLCLEDAKGKTWRFRYSYWGSSQSYVFTKGWSGFVKEKKLEAGDVVSFEKSATPPPPLLDHVAAPPLSSSSFSSSSSDAAILNLPALSSSKLFISCMRRPPQELSLLNISSSSSSSAASSCSHGGAADPIQAAGSCADIFRHHHLMRQNNLLHRAPPPPPPSLTMELEHRLFREPQQARATAVIHNLHHMMQSRSSSEVTMNPAEDHSTPNQRIMPRNLRPNGGIGGARDHGMNTAPPPPAVAVAQCIRLKQTTQSDMTAPPPCLSLRLDHGRIDASNCTPDYAAARLAEPQQELMEPNQDGDHDCSDTDLKLLHENPTPGSSTCMDHHHVVKDGDVDHHHHRRGDGVMIPTQLRLFGVEVNIKTETNLDDSTAAVSDADDDDTREGNYYGSRIRRRRRRDYAVVLEETTASDLSSDHEFLCTSSAAAKRQCLKQMVTSNDHSNPNPKP